MATRDAERLRQVRSFPQLVKYLRDELGWPIEQTNFEELSFDWDPLELGIDAKNAAKIDEIKQLRPLESDQPWGIFFVKFEPKRLPVVALRRILGQLAVKKRASAKRADQRTWRADDLLFISAYGEGGDRQLSFAHFSAPDNERDIPTLRVLGWDGDDTTLKLEHVAETLSEKLAWPDDPEEVADWRALWASAFVLRPSEVIRTSKELAVRLAELAKGIRHRADQLLELESDRGPLRRLYEAFKTALIHDLKESDFADMYAQTITYGLFSAAVTGEGMGVRGTLVADDMATGAPITNPFLRELLASFLSAGGRKGKIDFDELGVQEVVELLRSPDTHLTDILRDFGNRTRDEDPVIHFYESFLKEYDKKRKVERGVFYTPQSVVCYIVDGVHELLRTEFGLEDGLASTVTWREMVERYPGLEVPENTSPDSPFVTVLDPATGTATFLVQVIDVVHCTMVERWSREGVPEKEQSELWNAYVPTHLLPRLFGYELMMAPYAIAHMKVGLKLLETGYRFQAAERARIYLTNALELAHDFSDRLAFDVPALAHEAHAVNEVKRTQRFTVVIGNPPYSGLSANMTPAAQRLVDAYKVIDGEALNERKLWLQDDYVKFLRIAQTLIDASGTGILGFITNHGYVANPTFRGLRRSLMDSFVGIRVLDLHGNANKRERSPDGSEDKNVFDIRQGVAICLADRPPILSNGSAIVQHADLWGGREAKYQWLASHSISHVRYITICPDAPYYLFEPQSTDYRDEYEQFWRVDNAMPVNCAGFITARDHFVIDFDRAHLLDRIADLANPKISDAVVRAKYFEGRGSSKYPAGDSRGWKLPAARKRVQADPRRDERVRVCLYRPFDTRFIYWTDWMIDWPRPDVMRHLEGKHAIALSTSRSVEIEKFEHVFCSRLPIGHHTVSVKEVNYVFPLYLLPDESSEQLSLSTPSPRAANFDPDFVSDLLRSINTPNPSRPGELGSVAPEAIFNYIYAVFHSPNYRRRYNDLLRVDFPRIPLPGSAEIFNALARLGGELVTAHLLEAPNLNVQMPEYTGHRRPEVEKPSWAADTVWIDKAQTAGFCGVPEEVWNFQIGGYQICEKWLKDRKGRMLGVDDIRHYQRMVVALRETVRIMRETDEAIEKHGGWPGAFQFHGRAASEGTYSGEPALRLVAEPKLAYGADDKAD